MVEVRRLNDVLGLTVHDSFFFLPASVISWTSSYSETGVLGEAELATAEKGKRAYDEAVLRLGEFITEWQSVPAPTRKENHHLPPTFPMPWGQSHSLPRR